MALATHLIILLFRKYIMKKNLIISVCLALLLSTSAIAEENKTIGSGTITFIGAIVEGNCQVDSVESVLKTHCWNGHEMEEKDYNLESNKTFSTKIGENKGSMKVNWISDNVAIMDVAYN